MRRCAVNILRRTCGRRGKNSSAVSSRSASAGPIARIFARRLPSPQGRLSRHLFGFFFSSEKRTVFFLRLLGSALFSPAFAGFLRRFYFKFELSGHVMMELDRNFVFSSVLNWSLQHDLVSINLQTKLVLHPRHNILGSDRTESFSRLAGREREGQTRSSNLSSQLLGFVQFTGFAFGPFLFQTVELTQGGRRHFISFAAWQQIIARIAAAHLHHIGFGAEARHIVG